MKNKLRSLTALLAVVLCVSVFSIPAYAQSSEPQTEQAAEETAEPEQATPNPFTPKGTGTVLDNATSEDEKEFYTIVTPDENVFYLVIDKQRDADNVYFLNAVTESDLMALAEKDGDTTTAQPVEPEPQPTVTPQPEEPVTEEPKEPEQPQAGAKQDGKIYVPGFGWVEDKGGGSEVHEAPNAGTGKPIGEM